MAKYQGDYFQGEFKNGLKHGFGIYYFANGEKYVGQYQYGKRQGKGTYSFPNGKPALSGNWSNNQFVNPGNVVIESKSGAVQMQTVGTEAVKKKTDEPALDKSRVQVDARPVNTVDTFVAKPRDAVALVLGIQNYQRLPGASFAANDAKQFRDHAIKYLGVPVDNTKLKEAMLLLVANDGPLSSEWLDHPLTGDWVGHRECHIGGDFLLIYRLDDSGKSGLVVRSLIYICRNFII